MGSHPLPNALDRRFFARNEIALDEGTADRSKGIAVMRVVVDAQRRAVFEDDAPRAFNLKGEQIEWILEPADFKLMAIERAGLNSATVVVRHQLVLLVTAADPCALVGECFRAGLVTDCDQVGWAAVKRNAEFGTRKARTLNDRLVVPGQETLCFAEARDAHGLKILFEKGASGIRMLWPQAHGFAADVPQYPGQGLAAIGLACFAQGLAAGLIRCECGEMIIRRPTCDLRPFDRLELAVREF